MIIDVNVVLHFTSSSFGLGTYYVPFSLHISPCVSRSTSIPSSCSTVVSCCLCNPIRCRLWFFNSVLVHSPVLRPVVTALMPAVTASHIIDSSNPTPQPRLSHRGRCRIFRLSSVSGTLSKRFYINRCPGRLSTAPKHDISL